MSSWRLRTVVSVAATLVVGFAFAGIVAARAKPLRTVSVATLAIDNPAVLAQQQGFFRRYGLNVNFKIEELGHATLEASVTGATAFSTSNPTSVLLAASHGLPVRIVCVANVGTPQLSAVAVLPNSPITSYRELAGKRIDTPALDTIGTLAISVWLKAHGVNPATVHFVEIPFQTMGAALQEHQVDAAWLNEPFLTIYRTKLHVRTLFPIFSGPTAALPIGTFVTSARLAAENPTMVRDFRAAVLEAEALADRDPTLDRATISRFLHIPAPVAARMGLAHYPASTSMAPVLRLETLMKRVGMLPRSFNLAPYVFH